MTTIKHLICMECRRTCRLHSVLRRGQGPGREDVAAKRTIHFGIWKSNGGTVHRVQDNGVGFDMADADRLFAIFQRLHHGTTFAGDGVGLASAQRAVNRHGGQIRAQSQPGEGATFFFSLGDSEQAAA